MKLKRGHHTITYATPQPVLLSVNGQPATYLRAGSGRLTLRDMEGEISFDPPKVKVQLDVVTRDNKTEQTDDIPPPAPTPPPNYLAALREKVKRSMGVTREAFADFKSVYEVIDNLDDFEEDREARTKVEEVRQGDTSSEEPQEDKNERVESTEVKE